MSNSFACKPTSSRDSTFIDVLKAPSKASTIAIGKIQGADDAHVERVSELIKNIR